MDERLLAGAGGTLSLLSYDANGDLADVDGTNAPTVTVTDSAGATAFAVTGVARTSAGTYTATVPATATTLDVYSVAWVWPNSARRSSHLELVGSFIFTVAGLQAFDSALANETTYPPARIRLVRQAVEERFERAAGVSFTLRGRREVLSGSGGSALWLGERLVHDVTAIAVGGTAGDASALTVSELGLLTTTGSFAAGTGNVSVLYTHGHDPTPVPIQDAGMRYARELIVKGAFDDLARATGIQTELGFFRITQANKDRPTGIPDVDAVLMSYDRRVPMIA